MMSQLSSFAPAHPPSPLPLCRRWSGNESLIPPVTDTTICGGGGGGRNGPLPGQCCSQKAYPLALLVLMSRLMTVITGGSD